MNNPKEIDKILKQFAKDIISPLYLDPIKLKDFSANGARAHVTVKVATLEQFERDVLTVIGKDDRDYSQDNADARSKELLVACATSCNEVRKDQRLRLTVLLEQYRSGGRL